MAAPRAAIARPVCRLIMLQLYDLRAALPRSNETETPSARRLHGFDIIVCGHSHVPGIVRTPRGVYVNTGTWTCGLRTYAQWTGERFQVLDVDSGRELGDEEFVGLPAETEPEDLFRWWARHHRGFLRFEL